MVVVVLAGVAVLFMSAFYGSVVLYRIRPGAVAASRYFYDHAPPGSVLGLGSPNVPARVGANYDGFGAGSSPPPLTAVEDLQGHRLGTVEPTIAAAGPAERTAGDTAGSGSSGASQASLVRPQGIGTGRRLPGRQ